MPFFSAIYDMDSTILVHFPILCCTFLFMAGIFHPGEFQGHQSEEGKYAFQQQFHSKPAISGNLGVLLQINVASRSQHLNCYPAEPVLGKGL